MHRAIAFARNTRALTRFSAQAAPVLWRRMAEDRKRIVLPSPRIPKLAGWRRDGLQAAWIGHSTVLIQVDGFTILTDPVFSTRIGIKIGATVLGLKRLVRPAVDPTELPTPDLILL